MKILAVENNAELLKLLSHLLEKEGFEVYTAKGGSEALEIYACQQPAIACLDVLLDDMSGIEVCRHIRKENALMPIILITSKSRQADISEGMAAGATEYIVKPFDLAGITQLMHKTAQTCLMRENATRLDMSFVFGSLQVFPNRLEAKRGETVIPLSLRETSLLGYFHAHAGQTLSIAQLAPFCWHSQGNVDVKAVQWQIGQLRKKIEVLPEEPQLLRGNEAGYIFG